MRWLAYLVLAVCLVACETPEKAQNRKIRESIRKTMRHARNSGYITLAPPKIQRYELYDRNKQ